MNDDGLIDRVAGAMTDGQLPGDFRARVVARLPKTRRAAWVRFALPAGAIGAVALAWSLTGTTFSTGSMDATAGPGAPAPSVSPAGLAVRAAGPAEPAAPVGSAGPAEPAEPAGPVEVDPLPFLGLEPLSAPSPILIAPIQPIPPSIAPITVEPIIWDQLPL